MSAWGRPFARRTFSEKQDASFVNWLSNDKFTIPDGINFVAAAQLVTPAVVHVKSSVTVSQRQRGSNPFEELFGLPSPDRNQMPREARSSGSGVIISEDGFIVTNNHVIENANKVEISLENNTRYTARVIGTDPTTDLALFKIEFTTSKEMHQIWDLFIRLLVMKKAERNPLGF